MTNPTPHGQVPEALIYAELPDLDDTLWLAIGQHRRAITIVETSAAAKAVDAAVHSLLRAYADATHALRASHGQAPSGAGEAAEHYRNAIASACEGWTMPDGLRKHLETALWTPPTPQPTPAAQAAESVPEGFVAVPVEVANLYDLMHAAFVPTTFRQGQIEISLELARKACGGNFIAAAGQQGGPT